MHSEEMLLKIYQNAKEISPEQLLRGIRSGTLKRETSISIKVGAECVLATSGRRFAVCVEVGEKATFAYMTHRAIKAAIEDAERLLSVDIEAEVLKEERKARSFYEVMKEYAESEDPVTRVDVEVADAKTRIAECEHGYFSDECQAARKRGNRLAAVMSAQRNWKRHSHLSCDEFVLRAAKSRQALILSRRARARQTIANPPLYVRVSYAELDLSVHDVYSYREGF